MWKMRELQVAEVADFIGAASFARDLGGFFELLKLVGGTSEAASRAEMISPRTWSGCKAAPIRRPSQKKKGEFRPGRRNPTFADTAGADNAGANDALACAAGFRGNRVGSL